VLLDLQLRLAACRLYGVGLFSRGEHVGARQSTSRAREGRLVGGAVVQQPLHRRRLLLLYLRGGLRRERRQPGDDLRHPPRWRGVPQRNDRLQKRLAEINAAFFLKKPIKSPPMARP